MRLKKRKDSPKSILEVIERLDDALDIISTLQMAAANINQSKEVPKNSLQGAIAELCELLPFVTLDILESHVAHSRHYLSNQIKR